MAARLAPAAAAHVDVRTQHGPAVLLVEGLVFWGISSSSKPPLLPLLLLPSRVI